MSDVDSPPLFESEVPPDLTRAVVRGAGVASVLQLASQVIALGFYIAMARLTTPAVFGTFAAAIILVGVTGLFAESGMQAAVVQRRERVEEAAATAVVATLAGGALLSLVALVAAIPIGLYFHSREIGVVAASLAGLLFLNAAPLVPAAIMQRRFMALRRSLLEPITTASYGLATTIALAAGLGVWGFVVGSYASTVARTVAAWLFVGWSPNLRKASFAMWRELAGFGRHLVASEFLREITDVGTTALLGHFLGTAPLGYYRAGARLANQAASPIITASITMLLPAFARIAHEEERLRAAAMRALRMQSVLVFPLSLAFIPLGERIVVTLLGERWHTAGIVVAALAGLMFSLPPMQIAAEVFKGVGRPEFVGRQALVAATGALAAIAAALPFGVEAAAVGVSIAALIVALYSAAALARLLRISLRRMLLELAPQTIASLAMAGILLGLNGVLAAGDTTLERIGVLAVEALVGGISYLAILRVIQPPLVHELRGVVTSQLRAARGA